MSIKEPVNFGQSMRDYLVLPTVRSPAFNPNRFILLMGLCGLNLLCLFSSALRKIILIFTLLPKTKTVNVSLQIMETALQHIYVARTTWFVGTIKLI